MTGAPPGRRRDDERVQTYRRAGLEFGVRDSGPPHGDVVVLLHGFPQDGSAYDDVVPRLTAAGLRTLVPDQRGYSAGARPAGRRAYRVPELVADVVALLDAAGVPAVHVVGHDWGGAVAWAFAMEHPSRTRSLIALSTPHPAAARRAALRSSQLFRSAYIAFFQLPRLPERLLLADDGARLRALLVRSGLREPWVGRYAERMLEPGALTAALAWYRALGSAGRTPSTPVRVPTTHVHGRYDPFFAARGAELTPHYVAGPFRSVTLDAGHWLPELHPEAVADVVLERAR